MEVRPFGINGPMVSLLGLGCNNFGMLIDEAASAAVVGAALDAGVTHFDTAEMYGGGRSEEYLGRALGNCRDDVVIATKASPRAKGSEYLAGALEQRVRDACEGSLKRLGTDRIDVYYQHYPDAEAPYEEVLSAMESLVKDGKILHAACSNYSGQQLARAAEASDRLGITRFCANQVEWSLLRRSIEAEVIPAARSLDVSIVPYFPLASGMLTGKYRRGEDFPSGSRLSSSSYFAGVASDENFAYVERLAAFAKSQEHTILELAFGWLAAQEGVPSIIAGATSAGQVSSNAAAVTAWTLTPEDLEMVPSRL